MNQATYPQDTSACCGGRRKNRPGRTRNPYACKIVGVVISIILIGVGAHLFSGITQLLNCLGPVCTDGDSEVWTDGTCFDRLGECLGNTDASIYVGLAMIIAGVITFLCCSISLCCLCCRRAPKLDQPPQANQTQYPYTQPPPPAQMQYPPPPPFPYQQQQQQQQASYQPYPPKQNMYSGQQGPYVQANNNYGNGMNNNGPSSPSAPPPPPQTMGQIAMGVPAQTSMSQAVGAQNKRQKTGETSSGSCSASESHLQSSAQKTPTHEMRVFGATLDSVQKMEGKQDWKQSGTSQGTLGSNTPSVASQSTTTAPLSTAPPIAQSDNMPNFKPPKGMFWRQDAQMEDPQSGDEPKTPKMPTQFSM